MMRPSKSSRLELEAIRGHKSEFEWIQKDRLQIDRTYQRQQSPSRINEIAKNWSWDLAGAIDVVRRDGAYWVVDGGHRLGGAMKRPDVSEILCLVHEFENVSDEADFFFRKSRQINPMKTLDQHRASLAAGHELAVMVQKALDANGLKPVSSGKGSNRTVRCLGSIRDSMRANPHNCEEALRIATILSEDNPVEERFFGGAFYILSRSPEILNERNVEKLTSQVGYLKIKQSILTRVAELGGGWRTYAIGILDCVNKSRRKRCRLESIDAGEE